MSTKLLKDKSIKQSMRLTQIWSWHMIHWAKYSGEGLLIHNKKQGTGETYET